MDSAVSDGTAVDKPAKEATVGARADTVGRGREAIMTLFNELEAGQTVDASKIRMLYVAFTATFRTMMATDLSFNGQQRMTDLIVKHCAEHPVAAAGASTATAADSSVSRAPGGASMPIPAPAPVPTAGASGGGMVGPAAGSNIVGMPLPSAGPELASATGHRMMQLRAIVNLLALPSKQRATAGTGSSTHQGKGAPSKPSASAGPGNAGKLLGWAAQAEMQAPAPALVPKPLQVGQAAALVAEVPKTRVATKPAARAAAPPAEEQIPGLQAKPLQQAPAAAEAEVNDDMSIGIGGHFSRCSKYLCFCKGKGLSTGQQKPVLPALMSAEGYGAGLAFSPLPGLPVSFSPATGLSGAATPIPGLLELCPHMDEWGHFILPSPPRKASSYSRSVASASLSISPAALSQDTVSSSWPGAGASRSAGSQDTTWSWSTAVYTGPSAGSQDDGMAAAELQVASSTPSTTASSLASGLHVPTSSASSSDVMTGGNGVSSAPPPPVATDGSNGISTPPAVTDRPNDKHGRVTCIDDLPALLHYKDRSVFKRQFARLASLQPERFSRDASARNVVCARLLAQAEARRGQGQGQVEGSDAATVAATTDKEETMDASEVSMVSRRHQQGKQQMAQLPVLPHGAGAAPSAAAASSTPVDPEPVPVLVPAPMAQAVVSTHLHVGKVVTAKPVSGKRGGVPPLDTFPALCGVHTKETFRAAFETITNETLEAAAPGLFVVLSPADVRRRCLHTLWDRSVRLAASSSSLAASAGSVPVPVPVKKSQVNKGTGAVHEDGHTGAGIVLENTTGKDRDKDGDEDMLQGEQTSTADASSSRSPPSATAATGGAATSSGEEVQAEAEAEGQAQAQDVAAACAASPARMASPGGAGLLHAATPFLPPVPGVSPSMSSTSLVSDTSPSCTSTTTSEGAGVSPPSRPGPAKRRRLAAMAQAALGGETAALDTTAAVQDSSSSTRSPTQGSLPNGDVQQGCEDYSNLQDVVTPAHAGQKRTSTGEHKLAEPAEANIQPFALMAYGSAPGSSPVAGAGAGAGAGTSSNDGDGDVDLMQGTGQGALLPTSSGLREPDVAPEAASPVPVPVEYQEQPEVSSAGLSTPDHDGEVAQWRKLLDGIIALQKVTPGSLILAAKRAELELALSVLA